MKNPTESQPNQEANEFGSILAHALFESGEPPQDLAAACIKASRSLSKEIRGSLPIFIKEQYACPPVLAPGFDVFFSAFFGTHSPNEEPLRIYESRELLEHFPGDILLLPATEYQIVRFSVRLAELQGKVLHSRRGEILLTDSLIEELASLLNLPKKSLNQLSLFSQLISLVSHLSKGLGDLNDFLSRRNVHRVEDILSRGGLQNNYEKHDFVDPLSTSFSVHTERQRERKTINIQNDAINVSSVLALSEMLGFGDRELVSSVFPSAKYRNANGINFLYVTRSKRVLRTDYSDIVLDDAYREIVKKVSGAFDTDYDFGDEVPHIRPVSVSEALRYCEIRPMAPTALKCSKIARSMAQDCTRFEMRLESFRYGLDEVHNAVQRSDFLKNKMRQTLQWFPFVIQSVHAARLPLRLKTSSFDFETSFEDPYRTFLLSDGREFEASADSKTSFASILDLLYRKTQVDKMVYEERDKQGVEASLRERASNAEVLRFEFHETVQAACVIWGSNLDGAEVVVGLNRIFEKTAEPSFFIEYSMCPDLLYLKFDGLDYTIKDCEVVLDHMLPQYEQLLASLKESVVLEENTLQPSQATLAAKEIQVSYWFLNAKQGDFDTVAWFRDDRGFKLAREFVLASTSLREHEAVKATIADCLDESWNHCPLADRNNAL